MYRLRQTLPALLLLFLVFTAIAVAQPRAKSKPLFVDFRQAANDDKPNSLGDVHWIHSILQKNNSVYFEGMSVPQRIILANVSATTGNKHTFTFSHKATKNGKHAYDYLTSYNQALVSSRAIAGPTTLVYLNNCGNDLGPQSELLTACTTTHGGPYTAAVDVPDAMGTTLTHDITNSAANYESTYGNRTIQISGDAPISSTVLMFNGYSRQGKDEVAEYTLMWTSASASILVEMAGHLSMGNDVYGAGSGIGYGNGFGTGSIPGASYHFKLGELDGRTVGSRDNQIKDVGFGVSLDCDITGPDVACAGTQSTFVYNTSSKGLTYSWKLSDNTSGAAIIGTATGRSVVVDAGKMSGGYSLITTISYAARSVSCTTKVLVGSVSVTAAAAPLLCYGGNIPVTVAATGGTAPYTGTGTFSLGSGTHSFTVVDANGCSATTSVTITEPRLLAASANTTAVICNTNTAEVTVSATGGKPPYKGTGKFLRSPGTHAFTVEDDNNCITATSVTVPSSSVLLIASNETPILCNGGTSTVTVSATGGTPPYTGIGTFSRGAGTYSFTVSDANSCSGTRTVTITEPPQLNASASAAVSIQCNGGSAAVTVSATGGTPPYSGTGTFNRTAGTHSFTVTDGNGCTATTSVTLTEPATALSASASAPPISCSSSTTTVTVTATGGTPPYTGTGTFSRGAGTYSFIVTDANSCSATTSVTIVGASQLNALATATPILCNGGTSSVTVSASGGTAPYTGVGTFTRSAGTYNFTVTDANSCTAAATITITEPSAFIASATTTTPILCNGGSATVTVTATGGTPPYTGTGTFTRTAGTYSFTVTDANNCASSSATVTITEPTPLAVSASATTIACNVSTSTVTVTASGGTPPYTGTGTFTRGAGTHSFTVTDANSCSVTKSVTITGSSPITVSAAATSILCSGGTSVVTVTASGGATPYTGTGTFNRTAGTHTFTVTDANSCSGATTITITQPATFTASASTTTPILCNGGSAAVTVTATGGTPPYTGTGTFSRTAGTYSFTVTDANNCSSSTATVTITEPAQLAVSANATSILCNGGNSAVTVTASGGTPPYSGTGTFNYSAGTYTVTVTDYNACSASTSITLTEPSSLSATASATPVLCNSGNATVTVAATGGTAPYSGTGAFSRGAGTHSFTVTDANNCTTTTSITITAPGLLIASATATPILCNGGTSTVTVSASGGASPYTGTGTFSRSAGTHSFTVTDANNCSATTSITITEPPQLMISANAPPILCNGGTSTVTITASGGKPPYTGTGTFSYSAGTYTISVTDDNACTASTSLTITEPPAMTAAATATQILCNGGNSTVTVTASGGTQPYSGTGTFTYPAGTYTITVTDYNGCRATTSITISEPPALAAGANATPILCNGGGSTITVAATGGTPPYSGTGTFTRGAGSYSFTVTDANNCSSTAPVTITEPPLLIASSTATPILCNGGSTNVIVSATGGTSPYTGTGSYSRGVGTYSFTVTDANGCTSATSITLTEPTVLTVALSASTILCNGGNSTITVTASGGTSPYSGTGTYSRGAGTYSFTVTDDKGCMATASITITEPPAFTAAATSTPILCNGGSSTVTVTATGGTAPYTGTGTFSYPAGTYSITVTDYNGCTAMASVTILEPPVLAADADAAPILCNGAGTTIVVSATGGTKPYTGIGSFTRGPGTYIYTVTDANGCWDTTSITITEPPLLIASSIGTPILCNGGKSTITVSASGGTPAYIGTGVYSRPAGTHVFTVTDANGCTATTTITITEPQLLDAFATATPILCNGDLSTVTVTVSGGTPPYTGTGTFSRSSGTHYFTVIDSNGCSANAVVSITEPPLLTATIDAPPIPCHGGTSTITITATGGTPPYSGTGSFTRGPGTHIFTVIDANGCKDTVSATLTEPPLLTISASWTPVLCFGDLSTVTVTASGGTQPYTGTGTFTLGAGIYTLTVSDANGCNASTIVTITQPTQLLASGSAPAVSCGKDTAIVTVTAYGGTPPYTGTGSFIRTGGTHTFIVIDANGCKDTVQVTVAGPPPLYATSNATPILCNGGLSTITVSAYGGTPPYNGIGTFIRGAGTYTFTVTDANSCSDRITITVVEPPPLIAICKISDCVGGMRDVSAVVSGGTPPYSYSWSPGNVTTPIMHIPCTFSGTITLVVRDANWDPNDPNNSSCEATCSLTIYSKEGQGSAAVPSASEYALYENYPNPFNPSTTIKYFVPEPSLVRLSVVNTLGQTIETLVDEEVQSGEHFIMWNAGANRGMQVPSGSYFYRIHATSLTSDRQFVSERMMFLLK